MHVRRRLGPAWGRGVVASAALVLVTACDAGTGRLSIEEHDMTSADRAACQDLVADLPASLAGEEPIGVDAGALGAAWGNPPYVLTCGVPEPPDYTPTAECSDIKGVGWWVPDDELSDLSKDARAVALSRTPYVEVLVPADYRTDGIDRALAELAPAMREHLTEGRPCL